jgi:beta-lactam-binding protein with PASTA domain
VSKKRDKGLLALAIAVGVVGAALVGVLLFVLRLVVVPDVTLKSVAEATAIVEHVGLTLGAPGKIATDSVGPGLVAEQSPAPATKAPRRSSVEVTVAVAPVEATVPDVAGRQIAEAQQQLTDALYLPISVSIFETETPRGVVIGQAPSAGASWMTGRPVAMGVAAGPDDGTGVKVPDLKGESLEAAMATLGKAGLAGTGFVVDISTPAANVVVEQMPKGGVVVRPGTTVLMLLKAP